MKKQICRVLAFAMLLTLVASALPIRNISAAGSYTLDYTTDSRVVVIDAQFISEHDGATHFNIPAGAFSVTVIGNIDVTLIFQGDANDEFTIDRSDDTAASIVNIVTAEELSDAGKRLAESDESFAYSGAQYYIPTWPFRVTGGARVRAAFEGKTTFRAGYNGWVSNGAAVSNVHGTNGTYQGGYAGIQVDGDSSLTIDAAANGLFAYGAYPLAGETVTYGGRTVTYPDDPLYVNPYFAAYYNVTDGKRESVSEHNYVRAPGIVIGNSNVEANGGGAGIGGGVSHDTTTIQGANNSYAAGTPGEIVINGGVITAAGGHQAAGIGGGVNSSSTTSKIEINGGTITAIGGRWACGIGDGDSIQNLESSTYQDEKQIVINGGAVNAYGGTAAAAIGTTDSITEGTNYQKTHGLSIILAGGTIMALSGEADTSSGSDVATAAIGVGQNTDMNDNSISVASEATISAASFSQYAISNCGTDASEIPSVNIDPDGYMYLARFPEKTSDDKTRNFVCYNVKADALGNPMLVEKNTYDLFDFDANNYDGLYYALDRTNKKYYLVDKDGNALTEAEVTAAGVTDYAVDLTTLLVYPGTLPALSYYFLTGETDIVETYSVPANYKAIAMTLPDPTMVSVSGTYVLEVPDADVDENKENDTYVVIQKPTAGTSSGEIDASNATHVSGTNDGVNVTLTPNITEDAVAKELTDLDVIYDTEDLVTKYHGRFYPTTYAYTVYLPRNGGNAIEFDLFFAYDTTDVSSVSVIQDGQAISNIGDLDGSNTVALTLDAGAEKTEIWIKKTDKEVGQADSPVITYKVTVVRKPLYVLEIDPLSKVYDGERVNAQVTHMYIPGEGLSSNIGTTDLKDKDPVGGESEFTYRIGDGTAVSMDALTEYTLPTYETEGKATFRYRSNRTAELTVSHKLIRTTEPGKYQVVTTITRTNQIFSVTIQIDVINRSVTTPGVDSDGVLSEAISNFQVVKDSDDESASIILQSDDRRGTYQYNLITVSLGDASIASTLTDTQVQANRDTAIQTAVEQMAKDLEENHWTMASETVEYQKGVYSANYPFDIAIATANGNNSVQSTTDTEVMYKITDQTVTGRVLVTASYDHDVDVTSLLTAEDMENIEYEYHVAATGEVASGEKLDGPPKDAGTYHVRATLEADTFEAEGIDEFIIEKRVIHITGVTNWRTYLTEAEIVKIASEKSTVRDVGNYGELVFDNLVEGDTVTAITEKNDQLGADSAFVYYDGGAQLQISYTPTKILILPIRLADKTNASDEEAMNNAEEDDSHNYRFPDAQKSARYKDGTWYWFTVPGELAYVVDDAVFKKPEIGEWDKFWPTTENTPLQWVEDENGTLEPHPDEKRIDYHSPSNTEHREYVYLHTVNEGKDEARYAVDIEYGALQYTYSKTVWNVNTHSYEGVDGESIWSGNEGVNNKVTIYNRSNRDIYFSAAATLDSYFGAGCEVFLSQESNIDDVTNRSTTLTDIVVWETDEGATEAEKEIFYVYLQGVPQMSSPNDGLRSTGVVTITISGEKQTASASE